VSVCECVVDPVTFFVLNRASACHNVHVSDVHVSDVFSENFIQSLSGRFCIPGCTPFVECFIFDKIMDIDSHKQETCEGRPKTFCFPNGTFSWSCLCQVLIYNYFLEASRKVVTAGLTLRGDSELCGYPRRAC
jgi:hypothetical protein